MDVCAWTARDTYYSHGFLVPFICAFLVWHKRKILAKIPLKKDSLGWVLFGVGLYYSRFVYYMECGVFIGVLFIACTAGYGAFVGRKRLVKAVDVSYHVFGVYGASAGSR